MYDPFKFFAHSIVCRLYFQPWIHLQTSTIRCRIFKKIETKRWCCATILDLTVMSNRASVSNFFITWSLLCCLILQIVWFDWIELFIHFWPKSLQRPSMRNVGGQTYTTVSQSQQWAFTSESTILHIYSNRVFLLRGVKNRTENRLLLINYDAFWCKNLDNIGPHWTSAK